MELTIADITALKAVVQQLLQYANGRKKIVFTGAIGAGKTTFIQALCSVLGVKGKVTSPTFSLVNEYQIADTNELVYHLDLYRLKSLEEALHIGIEELLYNDDYCFIEWPQLIEPILPEEIIQVDIKTLSESSRKFVFL